MRMTGKSYQGEPNDDGQKPSRERSRRRRGGRRGVRARLPGAATVQWLIAAWTDSGRAAAAAAELAAIAGAVLLLTYAGTIIALTGAGGAALFAVRAAVLSRRPREPLEDPGTANSGSLRDATATGSPEGAIHPSQGGGRWNPSRPRQPQTAPRP